MSSNLLIDTKQIRKNILEIKNKINGARFCAVVKANCYGIGIELCNYIDDIVDQYAVATTEEANSISEITSKQILVLSPLQKEDYLCEVNNIEYTIENIDTLKWLLKQGKALNIHIAVNTGMNRYGVKYAEFKEMIKLIYAQNKIKLIGVFSHFYKNDKDTMISQYSLFNVYVNYIKKIDNSVICHISNSKGICYPIDMVRVGIELYNPEQTNCLTLTSKLLSIRVIHKNDIVSYNANYMANKTTKIGVVALGYADGIMRKLGGGKVIINGKMCNIIGDVCMDCFMVDLSGNKNAKIGEEVIIFGKSGKNIITICHVADKCGTISYEILTRLGSRIKRVYN